MEDVTIYANSAYNNISTGEKIFRDAGQIVNNDGRKIDRTSLMNMLGDDAYHSLQSAQRAYRVGRNLIVWGWITFFVGLLLLFLSIPIAIHSEMGFLFFYMLGLIIFMVGNIMLPAGYAVKGVNAGRISRIAERYNKEHSYA